VKDGMRHVQSGAQAGNALCLGRGFGPEPVVDGCRDDRAAGGGAQEQQRDTVGPSADRNPKANIRRNKPIEIGSEPRQSLAAGKGQRQPAVERAAGSIAFRSARIESP
jgi:hypothetical protein